MDKLTKGLIEALALWPASMNELARRAGVADSTYVRIRQGGHFNASPQTVEKTLAAVNETLRELRRARTALEDALD